MNTTELNKLVKSLTLVELDLLLGMISEELHRLRLEADMLQKNTGLTVLEFTNAFPHRVRVNNVLRNLHKSGYTKMTEITKRIFLSVDNCGPKTWHDFKHIIDHELQGTPYEVYQKILQHSLRDNEMMLKKHEEPKS